MIWKIKLEGSCTMALIRVQTTLPDILDGMVRPFETDRLIIRPLLHPTDLQAYRTIRSQAAAMSSTHTGMPDASMEMTEAKLKRLQPPYKDSHVYFGIFLKDHHDGSEGELIGDGGVHKFFGTETGWPEFGYKLKQEYWGCGYATEFARGFWRFWWSLPRTERQMRVALRSVAGPEEVGLALAAEQQVPLVVPERLCAWTKVDNTASQRILLKIGFESFEGLENGFVNWRSIPPELTP